MSAQPAAPLRLRHRFSALRDAILPPLLVFVAALALWEALVRLNDVPIYVLPAPSIIAKKLVEERVLLFASMLVTLRVTLEALVLASVAGLALALAIDSSKALERAVTPLAVVLQVTPIIAIAPLLLVYLEPTRAVLICAFLVAFFPIFANARLGLASVDRGLLELFELYRANAVKTLLYLRLPSATPQFLTGLRVGGGLALIGAVVGELAAGASGQGSGLAYRIVEAGFRLDVARMFAALTLIIAMGLLIHAALSLLSFLLLRNWHESARPRRD